MAGWVAVAAWMFGSACDAPSSDGGGRDGSVRDGIMAFSGDSLDDSGRPNADPPSSDLCADGSRARTRIPADIIVVVDNSGSMSAQIGSVVARINADFAAILDDAAIDYRVIVISRHGPIGLDANSCDDHGICIGEGLAGDICDPDGPPKLTDRFKHYSICIDSDDSFRKLAASFDRSPPGWAGRFQPSSYFNSRRQPVALDDAPDGWSEWLRRDATRTFLFITDDDSNEPDERFKAWMYSKDPSFFGTETNPNWVAHSILGLDENEPPTAPWQPSDALVFGECELPGVGRGHGAGEDYQRLSRDSGGLRFPICQNANFDVIFQAVATDIVSSSGTSRRGGPRPQGCGT